MSIREISIAQWTPAARSGSQNPRERKMDIYNTTRGIYSPSDFLQWREAGLLILAPKFQRRKVWRTQAKSFFIDTLLRGMPIPPIYLRQVPKPKQLHPIKEVVDGQQRLSAVLDFIDGVFRLSKSLEAPWSGKWYGDLSVKDQQKISMANFPTESFGDIKDTDVLDVFARLNTYSVGLNPQELRNGRFFGKFKRTVYKLAYDHLEFWRNNRIFGEVAIARMLEAELTSELLIAGNDGMQHKKNSIGDFYKKWDRVYPTRQRDDKRFRQVIGEIATSFEGTLKDTHFRGVPFFYTLYCVVYHRLFGLPGMQRVKRSAKPISSKDRKALRAAVFDLSEIIEEAREDPAAVPQKYSHFAAAMAQATNIEPRTVRFKVLYSEAFGSA